jgi:formate/nitrite transporter
MSDIRPPPMTPDPALFEAYTPDQIARRVEKVGVAKAGVAIVPLFALAVLAGAFIALGAMLYTVAITDSGLGLGLERIVGGLVFCLGLILVVVGGAELFTGNVLMVIGWADRKVTTGALLRNWGVVYAGNLVGGVGMAVLAFFAGVMELGDGAVGATTADLAAAKVALPFATAFFKGILCNVLVCLAIWLCFGARSVADKVLAILFPITAFVALGAEHSVANMYFIPAGMLAASAGPGAWAAGLISNLVPVTLGNIGGGGVFVALTYYVIYVRSRR